MRNLTSPEQLESENAHSYTPDHPLCSGVKEDGRNSCPGPLNTLKSKYYHKRMPQIASHITLLWFVWRREDNGDEIFMKDFATEEEAAAFAKKLNNIWALYHPDFPCPHTCCGGLWIPNEHTWEHSPSCKNRS